MTDLEARRQRVLTCVAIHLAVDERELALGVAVGVRIASGAVIAVAPGARPGGADAIVEPRGGGVEPGRADRLPAAVDALGDIGIVRGELEAIPATPVFADAGHVDGQLAGVTKQIFRR